jgi:hypothetical protein
MKLGAAPAANEARLTDGVSIASGSPYSTARMILRAAFSASCDKTGAASASLNHAYSD